MYLFICKHGTDSSYSLKNATVTYWKEMQSVDKWVELSERWKMLVWKVFSPNHNSAMQIQWSGKRSTHWRDLQNGKQTRTTKYISSIEVAGPAPNWPK